MYGVGISTKKPQIKLIESDVEKSTSELLSVKSGIYKQVLESVTYPTWVKKIVIDDSKQGTFDILSEKFEPDTLYIFNRSFVNKQNTEPDSDIAGTVVLKFDGSKYKLRDPSVFFIESRDAPELPIKCKEIADSEGSVFAEVIANIVFFHIDFLSPLFVETDRQTATNKAKTKQIMKLLVEKVVPELTDPGEIDIDKIKREYKKKLLFSIIKKQAEGKKASIQESIEKDKETLDKLRKEIIDVTRRLNVSIKSVSMYNEMSDELGAKAEMLWKRLNKIKGISDVKVTSDGAIVAYTDLIKLKDMANRTRTLGKFRISFKEGRVQCRNLTAEKLGIEYDHPHIRNGTEICWGNWSQVTEYIAKYEYDLALTMLLRLLKNWNPADCYEKLEAILRLYKDAESH